MFHNGEKTMIDTIKKELERYELTPLYVQLWDEYYTWENYSKAIEQLDSFYYLTEYTHIICKEGRLVIVNSLSDYSDEQSWEFIPCYTPNEVEINHKELSRKDILLHGGL